MNAKELRAISDRANRNKADNFWKAYSPNLFAHLERMAEAGNEVVKINADTQANMNPQNWLTDPALYKKVIGELKSRELDVTHRNDRDGTYIIIKW